MPSELKRELTAIMFTDMVLYSPNAIRRKQIKRDEYNHIRPHSSLGYRPPAPEAIMTTEIVNYLRKDEIFSAI